MVIFVEKNDYKLQGKFVSNITKVNKAIFNLKMSIFGTGLPVTKMFLAQMNGQLGKCNLGTFDLGKLFLDRTFPVNN